MQSKNFLPGKCSSFASSLGISVNKGGGKEISIKNIMTKQRNKTNTEILIFNTYIKWINNNVIKYVYALFIKKYNNQNNKI